MTHLYQLKRRWAPLGVELCRTKNAVQCADGEVRRFYFFAYDGKSAPLNCTSENDLVSHAEVARIERNLGLPIT